MSPRLSGLDRKRRRAQLVTAQQGLCHWCGGYVREDVPETHPHRAVLALLKPLSKGGTNARANQVAACRGCAAKRNPGWKSKARQDACEHEGA